MGAGGPVGEWMWLGWGRGAHGVIAGGRLWVTEGPFPARWDAGGGAGRASCEAKGVGIGVAGTHGASKGRRKRRWLALALHGVCRNGGWEGYSARTGRAEGTRREAKRVGGLHAPETAQKRGPWPR